MRSFPNSPRKRPWPFHNQGTGRCYGRHHSGTKFSGPRNDIHHLFSESKSVAIKQRFFCRRAFLLPAFFLPLLKQPFPLFRLVKCLDLGQQEPGEALQLLLGYAVLLILGGRRCLCGFLLLPIFRSGSFLQGCPLLPYGVFCHRSCPLARWRRC